MKIAIFEPYIKGIGGAQKVIEKYSNYLQSKGHHVEIFTQKYNSKTAYSGFNKLKINIIKPTSKNFSAFAFLKKFKGFDIFISNDFPSNFISIRNKPTVWVCYSPKRYFYDLKKYYFKNASLKGKVVLCLKKLFFKRIDLISARKTNLICPISKTIEERNKKYYSLDTPHIFYPGINFKDYKFNKYGDYFLAVSRLVKPKRMELAIKAMKFIKNKNIKLYVVGEGPEKDKLKRLSNMNPNVIFLGEVNDKKLKELYANCLGVIFTPLSEDWGLIPIEAAASKKATIGVNEGGLKETIINNKTGFLINNVTPKKIAEKIDILSDKKIAKEFGIAARKYCKKFDWKLILLNFEKEITNL